MRLTNYSNFALRTLQFAALRGTQLVSVEEISRAHRISKAHLVKVCHELSKKGYVETVRGRGGGMRLAKPASEITVGEIIRWTEAPLELAECFNSATNTCPLLGVCHLSRGFQRALKAFLAVLDDLTIADIVLNKDDLVLRLGAPSRQPVVRNTRRKASA